MAVEMPVLGHAFVGWATALSVTPHASAGTTPTVRASVWWIPTVLALAYAPDVVAQIGLALAWADAPRAAHSVVLALILAPLAGLGLGALLGVKRWLAVAVTVGSVVAHDLLDLFQSTGRQPFWPLSRWHASGTFVFLPASGAGESLLFAGLFALFLAARKIGPQASEDDTRRPIPHPRLTAAFVSGVCLAAGMTHYLREARERQLARARHLVSEGRFVDALDAASIADRWPSTVHPGRVDHVRAEALEGLGDLEAAIADYRRAAEADPTNFWALADWGAACATSADAANQSLAESLRARLSRDFSGHPRLPWALSRIDRGLLRQRRRSDSPPSVQQRSRDSLHPSTVP